MVRVTYTKKFELKPDMRFETHYGDAPVILRIVEVDARKTQYEILELQTRETIPTAEFIRIYGDEIPGEAIVNMDAR